VGFGVWNRGRIGVALSGSEAPQNALFRLPTFTPLLDVALGRIWSHRQVGAGRGFGGFVCRVGWGWWGWNELENGIPWLCLVMGVGVVDLKARGEGREKSRTMVPAALGEGGGAARWVDFCCENAAIMGPPFSGLGES
jgi:hypothetical protein